MTGRELGGGWGRGQSTQTEGPPRKSKGPKKGHPTMVARVLLSKAAAAGLGLYAQRGRAQALKLPEPKHHEKFRDRRRYSMENQTPGGQR